jgi:hypothetical protein
MNVCCYNRCHGVKGFWAVWDFIYDNVCLIIFIFPSLLTGNLVV